MERELLTLRDTDYVLHGQKYWAKGPLFLPGKGPAQACEGWEVEGGVQSRDPDRLFIF